jgi:hypothetical protein
MCCFVFFLLGNYHVAAETGSRGDYITVKIAVIGPGDELYFWWGHMALIIEDAAAGDSRFYDWGVFSFNADHFFSNFAFGRLIYMVTVSKTDTMLRHYIETNRAVTVYTLDLDDEEKEEIKRRAEKNVLPENSTYLYNHFSDNCVTRILYLIDDAVNGEFGKAYMNSPGRFTLREHVRRHTWFSPFWDWILNFVMGQGIDRPATMWEEMFLPSEVGRNIKNFFYTDAAGNQRPLVNSVEIINRSRGRPDVLDIPRKQAIRTIPWGLLLAAIAILAVFFSRKKPQTGHLISGLYQCLLGLCFGIAGSVLFFLTFFTNHDYTWHNINVIFVNPLLLSAIPLGILFAFTKNERKRYFASNFLKALWTYVFLGGLLTMAAKLSPMYYQQNHVTLVLLLPCALVLSYLPQIFIHRKEKHL